MIASFPGGGGGDEDEGRVVVRGWHPKRTGDTPFFLYIIKHVHNGDTNKK